MPLYPNHPAQHSTARGTPLWRSRTVAAALLLSCGLAFAQHPGMPSTPIEPPRQTGGGGGGVGIGINIDVGSVINLLRNIKKKDDPSDSEIEQSAKDQFQKARPSMTLEQLSQQFKADAARQVRRSALTTAAAARRGQRSTPQTESCKTNGNFETGTLSNWSGADNGPLTRSDPSRFNINTLGINSGAINADGTHQTIVGVGNDPTLGALLQQVRPSGGSSAVRIGNTAVNYGAELLSKSFKVSAADAIVGFSYALVMQNPIGHDAAHQPSFTVRVLDASGTDITNNIPGSRVQLAPSATPNVLVADAANPFFQTFVTPGSGGGVIGGGGGEKIVYKDWTCSEINLSDLIGQDVTIEFITIDCGYGGHYAYAYIDDFCTACGPGPEGGIKLATSDSCGVGKVCVDVTVPKTGTATGQATASLDIWQNGIKLTTYASPAITADGQICFPINPSTIPGLDLSKGFDYAAKADLKIGTYVLPSKMLGAGPDGQLPGKNNDYAVKCPTVSCGQPGQPPCPQCGTPGAPPCPACGQEGQPLCPACGQLGQPLCVDTCLAADYPNTTTPTNPRNAAGNATIKGKK